jgi:PAS domain S-box-containing protein
VELFSRLSGRGIGDLQILREDGGIAFGRAWRGDAESGHGVLVALPTSEQPTPTTLERLAHEYSFKDELDSTWAVRPLELERDRARTILVFEDPGGELLGSYLGAPMDVGRFLRLAVGLAVALGKLHQNGLIHKDINPANILVNATSGEVWLTGFGTASRLLRERQSPKPPEFIAGTLAYMAPEQTGRINRSIDSRSDLYSFGVTLYQMLTGSLPFAATDPMDWVHCQIARDPAPISEVPSVPTVVPAIIMKLLSKAAEERYQTAAGLERDLRRCLIEWEERASIEDFPLGEQDTPDRLLIPEKLYGREREVEALLSAFDRAIKNGVPELVLISGYSGIGKSSVVHELHRVLVPPRGLFASGKFDQHQSETPYATVARAFQSLIQPLLGQSEVELSKWRADFLQALGLEASLLLNLVPELGLIIGDQPAVADLPPIDAKARVQSILRRFVNVFARQEHPLALFFDDLQWLDAATLDVIENLLTEPNVHHLLLIGAYRSNEVGPSHRLMRKLAAIRESGAPITEVILAPLASDDIERLTMETLRSDLTEARPLARLIYDKTAGNPFFVIQFISNLAEEGSLFFDHAAGRWRWDLRQIRAKGHSENVVDLMVEKLTRLPTQTRMALQQLACIGNSAGFDTLAVCLGTTEEEVHVRLWPALRLQSVLRLDNAYKFAHDRIQEAAYSFMSEKARADAHLRIGRLLIERMPTSKYEDAIFEIVGQFNRGDLAQIPIKERERIAELNLLAGKRAKASSAYVSTLKYMTEGAALLSEEHWELRHDLFFELELNRAECEFLTGAVSDAAQRLEILSHRAASTIEESAIACLRVDLHMARAQVDLAQAVCLDYLRKRGVEWSSHPSKEEARREYDRISTEVKSRTIEDLIALPLVSDLAALATLNVLSKLVPMHTETNLLALDICYAVALGLEYGHGDGSCVAYVLLGMLAGAHFGDYEAGYHFARVGYELVEQRGLRRFQAPTFHPFGDRVMPWTKSIKACRQILVRGFEAANKFGPLTYVVFSGDRITANFLAAGDPLLETQRQAESGLETARRARFSLGSDLNALQLALVRTLRGLTPKFGCFDDELFDELGFELRVSGNPALAVVECRYSIRKLQARFFAGDYTAAIEASSRAKRLMWTTLGSLDEAEYEFYGGLASAASYDTVNVDERRQHLDALMSHSRRVDEWAENCPENFETRAALLNAEIARIEGRQIDAQHLYEKAILSATKNNFIHVEALANELAARFYAVCGFVKIARSYLRDARQCYLSWGAYGKVRQLEARYPQLGVTDPSEAGRKAISIDQPLDVAAVVKASQALSGEMLLPRLIERLMTIALQHAGAKRGLLILPDQNVYRIEAEALADGDQIGLRYGAAAGTAVPETIIRYVMRMQESVILDDAARQNLFSGDQYFSLGRQRSILCLPLIRQGRVVGLLYLENALASHVFTPDRATLLGVLGSQAAISLENARLYGDLQEREAKIRRLVDSNIIGICIYNLDRQILEANDAFLSIVGYTRDDVISGRLSFVGLTPPEWVEDDKQRLAELISTGTWKPSEKEFFRKDGSRVPVLLGSAIFSELKRQGIAFVVDLTERKRAEAELAHANRIATMGQLTASIAHEVNQPIAALLMNAGTALRWLERQTPDWEKTKQMIGRIINDAERATDILGRIRAFSKKAPAPKSFFALNEAILEVVGLTRAKLSDHGILLRTELAQNGLLIQGDRVQIQQVMMNLIMNAAEAMSETRDGERELLITTWIAAAEVNVAVRDSGPGFADSAFDKVFEAFYTTKATGLGLGLSICRSIIESHGGRLWASANVPKGAVLQFTVPAVKLY